MTKTLRIMDEDYDFEGFTPCDHCGHRAYYFIELESGAELSYCGHAFRKYEDKLWEVAVTVVDMSHLV